MSKVHIYGGGTFYYVRNHLALCAPAFGATAERLRQLMLLESELHLTKMVDKHSKLVTNDDVKQHISNVIEDMNVKCIIMNAALCDYDGQIGDIPSGKYATRLESREGVQNMSLTPSEKVISQIKEHRPDIVVVGFKTTVNENDDTIMVKKALRMNVDIVLANDVGLRKNILVRASGGSIGIIHHDSRDEALKQMSVLIREMIRDDSPIKNIRSSENFTTYWIEIKGALSTGNAFVSACNVLKDNEIVGEYLDSRWSKYHQNVYKISIKK